MRPATVLVPLLLAAIVVGCASKTTVAPQTPTRSEAALGRAHHFDLELVAKGFRQPVQVISRPGDARLYVVEQAGTIRAIAGQRPAARPLLDIRARTRARGEQGLLSAVFAPDGAGIVVLFTNPVGDTRVVRYPVTARGADTTQGRMLLAVPQPYPNHKGGTVLFDQRGRLLVGLGDGGSAYDPEQRAQDPDDLLGGILRRENGGWTKVALGLRNPWRMAFDDATGLLWIGDVGQGRAEEVDAIWPPEEGQSPLNLGWAAYEGRHRRPGKRLSTHSRLVWPLVTYDHANGRCSITGGEVYRGRAVPQLRGRYVYGDFCRGTMWSLDARAAQRPADADVSAEHARLPGLSSFGADAAGELYATALQGAVVRLVSPAR
ncbi:MAG TPA: PQQ-dependent sugar dehydrogenase [Solirubrobacteraceae bacterium]